MKTKTVEYYICDICGLESEFKEEIERHEKDFPVYKKPPIVPGQTLTLITWNGERKVMVLDLFIDKQIHSWKVRLTDEHHDVIDSDHWDDEYTPHNHFYLSRFKEFQNYKE